MFVILVLIEGCIFVPITADDDLSCASFYLVMADVDWDLPADLVMADKARLSKKVKTRPRKRGNDDQGLQQARRKRIRRSEDPQPQRLAVDNKLELCVGCIRVASDCTGLNAGAMAWSKLGYLSMRTLQANCRGIAGMCCVATSR